MNEVTPREIAGGLRCGTPGLYLAGAGRGYPQAARVAVEMWKIEFPQIAASTCFATLEEALASP